MSSALTNRPQQRAQHAWNAVKTARANGNFEEFQKQSKKLPVRIRMSGLGQALAFQAGKQLAPELTGGLDTWIQTVYPPARKTDLLERIIVEDSEFLKLATSEALLWLQWVKRFCEAKEEKNQKEEKS